MSLKMDLKVCTERGGGSPLAFADANSSFRISSMSIATFGST